MVTRARSGPLPQAGTAATHHLGPHAGFGGGRHLALRPCARGGGFVLNHSALATGSEKKPYQHGVFHRSANEKGAGLYINTNKTADSSKAENEKCYVIPWSHDEVLY